MEGVSAPPSDSGLPLAEAFIPASNFLFSSVTLPMGNAPGNGPNAYTVSLMSDANGHPGAALESFSSYQRPTLHQSRTRAVHFDREHPAQRRTPWIAVFPQFRDTAGVWFINSTGAIGLSRVWNDGVTWTASSDLHSLKWTTW